jgi:hypothetical protein
MTVSTLTFYKAYVAAAGQTVFLYDFLILEASHLKCYVDGVAKVFGGDYTVSGAGSAAGGNLTFIVPLVGGEAILLRRETPRAQATDLNAGQQFYEAALEAMADKLTLIAQEFPSLVIPTYPPGYFLKTKADGSGIEAVASVALGAAMPFDFGPAAPTTGTWAAPFFRFSNAPYAGGPIGWVLIVSGTPGTWVEFGRISEAWTDVRRFGVVGDGVTDDAAGIQAAIDYIVGQSALSGSGFTAAPVLYFPPDKTYLMNSGVSFDNINNLTIIAYGTRFHYAGAGKAFSFSECNYPKWNGGQIYLDVDDAAAIGLYITDTRYGIFKDFDISAADSTYDTLNNGIVCYAGAGGSTDVLYCSFENFRLNRLGQALTLQTADDEASVSRINANKFSGGHLQCTNGLLIKGCSTNRFEVTLENKVNQLEFRDNALGVGSCENDVFVLYYGSTEYDNRNGADANSRSNRVVDIHSVNSLGAAQASHLVLPGENYVETIDRQYGGMRMSSPRTLEQGRTELPVAQNEAPYSEDFTQWTATDLTVTPDDAAAPDGAQTADLLTQDVANGNVMIETAVLGNDLDNALWSGSIYLKAAADQYATIELVLYSGAVEATIVTRAVYVTTEWQRFFVSRNWGVTPGSGYSVRFRVYPTRKGGGATGALHAFGGMIHKGYPAAYQKRAGDLVEPGKFRGIEYDHSDAATAGTGEDDLKSTTIPSGVLGTKGGILILAAGTKTGGAGNKTIKLHLGATSWTVFGPANTTTDWRLEAHIFNTAVNAQRISWVFYDGATVTQGYETAAIFTGKIAGYASDPILKLTGECADAADTITQTMWVVDRY